MAIIIPARNYLTFHELMNRWQCTENDLRYAVICGAIKPCVRLVGTHQTIEWERAPWGAWVKRSTDDYTYALAYEPKHWVYLQEPHQTAPFDCRFELAADMRDADKDDSVTFALWYELKSPMTLEAVARDAVFLLKEVIDYEDKHGQEKSLQAESKEPTTRERNTLLKLVIGMAIKGYAFDPNASKSAATSEIANDLAEVGVSVTDETILKYLREATRVVLPRKVP